MTAADDTRGLGGKPQLWLAENRLQRGCAATPLAGAVPAVDAWVVRQTLSAGDFSGPAATNNWRRVLEHRTLSGFLVTSTSYNWLWKEEAYCVPEVRLFLLTGGCTFGACLFCLVLVVRGNTIIHGQMIYVHPRPPACRCSANVSTPTWLCCPCLVR